MKSLGFLLIAAFAIPSTLFLFTCCSRTTEERNRSTAVPKPTTAAPASTQVPPKSLIVVAGTSDDYARGIQQLLEHHGVPATIVSAASVSRERAGGFDLVIVVGKGRFAAKLPEFSQPVLGVGCCGCGYFGSLRLKNGSPWT